jgi:hypothetical protein
MPRAAKTVLKSFATLVLGVFAIGVILACIQFLFWGNSTSINIDNRSGAALHSLSIVVPGSVFSGRPDEMPPRGSVAFSASTRMVMPVRVSFDVDGHHHETFRRIVLPPLGAYMILIRIDEQMHISITPWIFWMFTKRPNKALERTADRREDSLSMISTLNGEAQLAVVSGRSACSR